ncbi:MAG: phenylacetate--CoA ligase [Desulfobacterales bacterium]|nr:phenylacetate--CoA ligase [Desulfobacterales bacterium]MBF0396614.1 phenylacetate--CoA ligase [Desulfobacterales bacterium]
MLWEPKFESMERDELEQLQLEKLQATLNRVYMNVPFYHKRFDELGIDIDSIGSIDDIRKLPFTTKDDLRQNYPYGLFAVPLREVVRIHASSGTTGLSTVVGYTKNDIRNWSNLIARILTAGGITKDDVVQISFNYGLFTGGFGHHYGAERIGASVIPISSGNTNRQIKIMQDFRTTALICTPSYAMLIADTIREMGMNINSLCLKYGLFGGEPWSEAMRNDIQDKLKIVATDNYGLSEVMGPGVAGECLERNGLHINEDHFIVEVINPHTLEPLPLGEIGELVITTLTKEAFPVIRFRTRDLTKLTLERCSCGRKFMKMSRVMGRTDDMLIIKGVNVFPSQIEHVLINIENVSPHYQIIVKREGAIDAMEIQVEMSENIFSDEMKVLERLNKHIEQKIKEVLGISCRVKLVEPKSLQRSEGKAKRVVDLRKI